MSRRNPLRSARVLPMEFVPVNCYEVYIDPSPRETRVEIALFDGPVPADGDGTDVFATRDGKTVRVRVSSGGTPVAIERIGSLRPTGGA